MTNRIFKMLIMRNEAGEDLSFITKSLMQRDNTKV